MKIGFLGAGNMAGAIIEGMVKKTFLPGDIYAFDLNTEVLKKLQLETDINICKNRTELLNVCDVLLLALKPNVLPEELPGVLKDLNGRTPLVISIAVGKTLSFYADYLGKLMPVIRVMPNINAKVSLSTSGFCANDLASEQHKDIVRKIFSSVGTIDELDEKMMPIFGAIAGSSPAFTYLYIDTLARAALKAGMPKGQALSFVAKSVMGSAKMVLDSTNHPMELVDMVCSPAGTTIEGISALYENSFENDIIKAFDAILQKDKLITEGKK